MDKLKNMKQAPLTIGNKQEFSNKYQNQYISPPTTQLYLNITLTWEKSKNIIHESMTNL